MKVSMSARIDIKNTTTAKEILDSLSSVPAGAKVTVYQDRYYPGEYNSGSSSYIKLTWEEER